MEMYELPLARKGKYLKWIKVLSIVMSFCFILASYFLFKITYKDREFIDYIVGSTLIVIPIYWIYMCFISVNKCSFEMTKEYIRVTTLAKEIKVNWNEVEAVHEYGSSRNQKWGILLKKDIEKIKRRNMINILNSIFGKPPVSISLVKDMYNDIDSNMFINTIEKQIKLAKRKSKRY